MRSLWDIPNTFSWEIENNKISKQALDFLYFMADIHGNVFTNSVKNHGALYF